MTVAFLRVSSYFNHYTSNPVIAALLRSYARRVLPEEGRPYIELPDAACMVSKTRSSLARRANWFFFFFFFFHIYVLDAQGDPNLSPSRSPWPIAVGSEERYRFHSNHPSTKQQKRGGRAG